ncbi:MAG: hypothetical protein JRG67_02160 [Deltaproteobacteria bacterium]|jgi:hypothetical protein|nr:hypothetical protein [Deltaproteobacteria bacterium]MBW1874592.1 hypothetical protein [Deltaproteobacteria bacterium]MBW2209838.1 hypothetical protein [Deltaproteobacteria bacterium]MBW2213676.1 hypothetical protein [Deltaproteobacteria bacterium]MBW2378583.1 hypothetical protein [Deltaproteobacteria bacterium]
MSLIRHLLVIAILFGASVSSGASAQSNSLARSDRASTTSSVPAEVLVVLAKEEPGDIDPQLKKLTALRRPPFNSFRSMKILSRPKLKLTPGKDALVSLPNGRRMKLTLLRVMPDGRYKVKAAINRPNKSDYLPLLQVVASAGDPFFVAGQTYQGGTLVVGVIVDPKKTAQ